jgi:hypothetical protein
MDDTVPKRAPAVKPNADSAEAVERLVRRRYDLKIQSGDAAIGREARGTEGMRDWRK